MDYSRATEGFAGQTIEVPAMIHRFLRTIPLALLALSLPAFATAASAEPASIKVDLSNKGGKIASS